MTLTMLPDVAAPQADGPFTGGVVVRQVEDDPEFKKWELMEPLSYRGRRDEWTVPPRFRTDFASVPRVVTWLIPRYGRYTKAAILHDYLCDVEVRRETITRADADGVFRRALRELGVAFLRRWLMWAAVRLGGAKEHPSTLWRPGSRPLARWILIAVPGLLFAALPVIAILAALGLFFLAESIVLAILEGGARRDADGTPLKEINEPKFPWTT